MNTVEHTHGIGCQQVLELLVDYVEGDLSPTLRSDLDQHLGHCPECVKFIQEYKGTASICREHLAKQMPCSLRDKLVGFLRQKLCPEANSPSNTTFNAAMSTDSTVGPCPDSLANTLVKGRS